MVNGGLNLSKLRSLMHDTVNASHPPPLCLYLFLSLSKNITPQPLFEPQCNTANATARKISELVEKKGVEFFGAEVWAAMSYEQRCTMDYLCGNHTHRSSCLTLTA